VSDLLDYIAPEAELRAREAQKKQARAKVRNEQVPVITVFLFNFN